MLNVVNTIIPVFVIILLGWLIRARNFLPAELLSPLNRMAYYIAIPAMIFEKVAGASFETDFQLILLIGTLIPVIFLFVLSVGLGVLFLVPQRDMGTFLQSSFHGNLGYIGLAVAYYFLGEEGLTKASILAGFLMLLQNFLATLGLQFFAGESDTRHRMIFFARRILGNPVIVSTLVGIVFSLLKIPLPVTINRSLSIISGLALPLALLVIGASLSFGLIRSHLRLALGASLLKVCFLPAVGVFLYRWLGVSASDSLPGLILLASPTATISYVMACEMRGSPDLASATISISTLLSSLGFITWLSFFG